MPYHVAKSAKCPKSKPWGVINTQTGDLVGCHDTRDAALKQQGALYANEPQLHELDPMVLIRNMGRDEPREIAPEPRAAARHLHPACGHVCAGTRCTDESQPCLMCAARTVNQPVADPRFTSADWRPC